MTATALMFLWLALTTIVTAQAPEPRVRITLERTFCLGECPVYKVTIDGDGSVTYEGREYVRVKGRQRSRIDPSAVAALLKEFDEVGFFNLKREYVTIRNPDGTESFVTDAPTTYITLAIGSRSKKITDYMGSPKALRDLERHIDEAAGTLQWVRIDEATVRRRAQSGWRANTEEGRELLRGALIHDEVGVVAALIDAGVDVNARNADGQSPLLLSVYFDPALTRLLLRAGAAPDDSVDGRTPLMQAACDGNADAVEALLQVGANPAARHNGRTARECAAAGATRKDPWPAVAGYKPPFVKDYPRVIALLDEALAKRRDR